jgi:predicted DNA-binding transcriptional regulator YafY
MDIAVSRTQFIRLSVLDHIFRDLFRRKRFGDVAELANRVNDSPQMQRVGARIGPKTIQRDLKLLKELGAPLKYDYKRRRYHYTTPTSALPLFKLTQDELLLLFVAERMAEQLHGPPVARALGGLSAKLGQHLLHEIGVNTEELRKKISFHGMPARPVDEAMWEKVFSAVRGDLKIRIDYQPVGGKERRLFEIEPVHLACLQDEWYLVAWDPEKRGFRHFSPSGIKSIEVMDELCEARSFNPNKYFGNRFGRFVGPPGQSWNVVLRFNKAAAPWIKERQWHRAEKKQDHADGGLTLSFPAPSLLEVKRWVLRWGGDVKVMAPKELREQVRQAAREIQRTYAH